MRYKARSCHTFLAFSLRSLFEDGSAPSDLSSEPWVRQDAACVSALAKQFFRELPRPLLCSAAAALRDAAAAADRNSDSR